MTYLEFVLGFLVLPLALLAGLTWLDRRRALPVMLSGAPLGLGLVGHAVLALVYTTPWDNYLVATRVWWYDPARVTGLTLGWVPVEEYLFFALQPLVSGLWFVALARRCPVDRGRAHPARGRRWMAAGLLGGIWAVALGGLVAGWSPGTYLALELAWALPPLILQVAVGGDMLWRARWPLLLALLGSTLFFALADALAIGGGLWTINPTSSLDARLGGLLPLEELVFFLLTNSLVLNGLTLWLTPDIQARLPRAVRQHLAAWSAVRLAVPDTARREGA